MGCESAERADVDGAGGVPLRVASVMRLACYAWRAEEPKRIRQMRTTAACRKRIGSAGRVCIRNRFRLYCEGLKGNDFGKKDHSSGPF